LQQTVIVGSEIGDSVKLNLINKAASCSPPIEIEVNFENLNDKAFIRVEIPASDHRPHCTASGTYKIREDGRNQALNPRELLAMFIESESDHFLSRFSHATADLRESIDALRKEIADTKC
jgi:ATP-dependent DNA helicase RecG